MHKRKFEISPYFFFLAVSGATTNKRLGSKSYTLSAGKYTIAAYIKQSGSKAGAFKLGYGIIKNGAIANADYKYQDNATTVTNEWKLYTHEFTLAEETVIAALVMNSKVGNEAAILVDNVTLTTEIATETPDQPSNSNLSER